MTGFSFPHFNSSYPLVPLCTVAINQPILLELRALGLGYVPEFAVVIAHALLLDVELVEARGEGIPQGLHVTLWMECLPWPDAGLGLTRLENEEK